MTSNFIDRKLLHVFLQLSDSDFVKIHIFFDGAVRGLKKITREIPHDEKYFHVVKSIIYENEIVFFVFAKVIKKIKCLQFTD